MKEIINELDKLYQIIWDIEHKYISQISFTKFSEKIQIAHLKGRQQGATEVARVVRFAIQHIKNIIAMTVEYDNEAHIQPHSCMCSRLEEPCGLCNKKYKEDLSG